MHKFTCWASNPLSIQQAFQPASSGANRNPLTKGQVVCRVPSLYITRQKGDNCNTNVIVTTASHPQPREMASASGGHNSHRLGAEAASVLCATCHRARTRASLTRVTQMRGCAIVRERGLLLLVRPQPREGKRQCLNVTTRERECERESTEEKKSRELGDSPLSATALPECLHYPFCPGKCGERVELLLA